MPRSSSRSERRSSHRSRPVSPAACDPLATASGGGVSSAPAAATRTSGLCTTGYPASPAGGNAVMATVSVRYFVNDVDEAIRFYCQNLGFQEVMHPAPAFAMLSRGDLRLVLSAPG